MRFFLSRRIKTKLALAFFAIISVGILGGSVGLFGIVSAGREFSQIGQVALPQVEYVSEVERLVAVLEVDAIALRSQPEADPERSAVVQAAATALDTAVKVGEDDQVSQAAAALFPAIDMALTAHAANAMFHFGFEGKTHALSAFFDALALRNVTYLEALSKAMDSGELNAIETDPAATDFARWRQGFEARDDALRALLADYGEHEADLLAHIEAFIAGDPENAASELTRLQARRASKLAETIAKLAHRATALERQAEDAKETAFAKLSAELEAFSTRVEARRIEATKSVYASVVQAERTERTITFIMAGVIVLGLALTFAAMSLTHRMIGDPLGRLAEVLHELSRRDAAVEIPYLDRHDEIGDVAAAADAFRISLERQQELEGRADAERKVAEAARISAEEKTLEVEAARRDTEAAKNFHAKKSAVADAFFKAFSRIIASAEKGDFSQRLGVRFDDDDYDALARGANRMMDAIETSLWETGQVVGDLAEGRLNTAMTGKYTGAFNSLKDNVNGTAKQLRKIVERINETGIVVAQDANLLSQSADELSRQSASQAASIEETNAALDHVTQKIATNTAVAEDMARQAKNAADHARAGSEVVETAIGAMSDIETSESKVTKIVSVINDISFQTNLLALNAGVEAARAGDAGKGFMVVAQEVRHLAQRASGAAREIDEQIQQSGKDVAKGVDMVRSTGEVLRRIVEAIATVESAAEKITESSHDQDNSIREVSKAMLDLDRITLTNAGAAEGTAAAVTRLNAMVADLETQLAFFLDEDGSLKSGLGLGRPHMEAGWVAGDSEDRRKETRVGVSIPPENGASFAAQ